MRGIAGTSRPTHSSVKRVMHRPKTERAPPSQRLVAVCYAMVVVVVRVAVCRFPDVAAAMFVLGAR